MFDGCLTAELRPLKLLERSRGGARATSCRSVRPAIARTKKFCDLIEDLGHFIEARRAAYTLRHSRNPQPSYTSSHSPSA